VRLRIVEPASAQRDVELELPFGRSVLQDELEARWLPPHPERVVIAALAERSSRRLGWIAAFVALGIGCAVLSLIITLRVREQIDTARELAASGSLVSAELVSIETIHAGHAVMRRVIYRLPNGEEGRDEHSAFLPGPLFADARHIIVMASRDGRRHAMVREDGHPLALD
jgi:hypothetical protein